jgi:hypothetical protein
MTRKIYKSAMGKSVDLGALLLQNEHVRSVGNMSVNAAGDVLDSNNKIIDHRNKQVQKQYQKTTNVDNIPVTTSSISARKNRIQPDQQEDAGEIKNMENIFDTLDSNTSVVKEPAPVPESQVSAPGGLAAAIARSREVKQELEKTHRQQQPEGIRKL